MQGMELWMVSVNNAYCHVMLQLGPYYAGKRLTPIYGYAAPTWVPTNAWWSWASLSSSPELHFQ